MFFRLLNNRMEDQYCIMSKALKRGGLRWELFDDVEEELAPPSLLVRLDDLVPKVNVPSAARDDFLAVDCFLDFPAGGEEEEGKDSVSESSYVEDNASNISGAGSFFSSELAVPEDDLAELEWVSHFVDDSSCDVSFVLPSSMEVTKARANRFDPTHVSSGLEGARGASILFPCPVPAKVRTKRQRPTRLSRTWSSGTGSLPLSPAVSSSVSSPCLIVNEGPVQPVQSGIGSKEPVQKKAKKDHPGQTNVGETGLVQFQRRCTHCQVQKTPQWRAGPLGPKTLCNACGVRYKSGRLFPEYRPAGSPTFSSEVHSNSHRKVLEMRRQNEAGGMTKFSQMIQSF